MTDTDSKTWGALMHIDIKLHYKFRTKFQKEKGKIVSRTSNSLRNTKYGLIGQISYIAMGYIVRTVFIRSLGAEYLGLNGLFTNILSILSLAELGVGSAITFSLYEPLAKENTYQIKALMRIFRNAYIIIGIWMGVAGLLFTPFLYYFIKDIPEIPNYKLIYLMFVANSTMTYFFSYKRVLISADQKKYIDSMVRYGSSIITSIFQIIVLIQLKNYIAFLMIKLLFTFLENYLISRTADRIFPFLKSFEGERLNQQEKTSIIKNIKALLFHKIGSVVVFGTDNLLISKFSGLLSVGIYSNYVLITGTIMTLISIVFQSVIPSIGNLAVSENRQRLQSIFTSIDFISFWIFGFSTISLFNLFNPFIQLWLGNEYLFQFPIVLVISINFYIQGQRSSILTFRDALGLFWYDRYKPLIESIINLIASILLVIPYGVIGVLLGTTISTLTSAFWIEPFVLYRYGFESPVKYYFSTYIIRIFIILLTGGFTWILCNLVIFTSIGGFVIRLIICIIVPNTIFYIIYRKTKEFSYLFEIIRQFLKIRKIQRGI